jgi:hypothetical protein
VKTDIRPTTTLPDALLTRQPLNDLGLRATTIAALIEAGNTIRHAIKHGNELLINGLGIQREAADQLAIQHLDQVLSTPELSDEVAKYAAQTFSPEFQRRCREIMSSLRLYWFTPETVRFLWQYTNLDKQDLPRVMQLLDRLSEAAVQSGHPAGPLDQHSLCRMINDGNLLLDDDEKPVAAMIDALVDVTLTFT